MTFAHSSKSALSPVRSAHCSRLCDDCVFTECNFTRICFADAERILYTLEGSEGIKKWTVWLGFHFSESDLYNLESVLIQSAILQHGFQ